MRRSLGEIIISNHGGVINIAEKYQFCYSKLKDQLGKCKVINFVTSWLDLILKNFPNFY